jgi:transcriptional regulator with GAF, ATPase, and Fis domain
VNTSRAQSARSKRKPGPGPLGLISELLALNRQRTPDRSLLEDVLKLLQENFKFDAATIYLLSPQNGKLEAVASVGKQAEVLEFVAMGQGQGLSAWSTLSGNTVFLRDRSRSRTFDPAVDFGTFLSMPIPVTDTPIGALTIGFQEADALPESSADSLQQIGDLLAFLIERFNYHAQLEHARAAIREVQQKVAVVPNSTALPEQIRAIVELALGLHHEINDQLAVIVGNLQCLLVDDSIRNQKLLYRLRRMQEASLRIRESGARLRDFENLHQSVKTPAMAGRH